MERRDSPRFGTRVIHRGQSVYTGEPSRYSVEEETDVRGRNQGGLATKGKLAVWKRRLEKVKQPVQELGEFLGRRGAYFLKRGNEERVTDACRRFEGMREKEGVSGARSLAQAAITSDARVFILECLGNLLRTTELNHEIFPALERESYIVDKAYILASQVGIPWRRKRTFVVGIKGDLATKGKLAVWMRRLEKVKQPVQGLGEFLGRRGAYFLKRGNGERAIYSFSEPIISLNRAHIMGEKPTEGYFAHPADAARLEEAQELHFNDYAKIITQGRNTT